MQETSAKATNYETVILDSIVLTPSLCTCIRFNYQFQVTQIVS